MPPGSRYRILVVEDHPDVSEMMVIMLKMLGHEVETARSVKETRERVAASRFDLLLVDYRLPDGTGPDVLGALPAPIPAILLTAQDEGSLTPAMREGFVRCLTKPVEMDSLGRSIREVCSD